MAPKPANEISTVSNFVERGNWATHRGDYPGNWSPYVPRNLVERYTKVGDWVCDPMMGSGTTLVECKLLGRNCVGVDVSNAAVIIALNRLDFGEELKAPQTTCEVYQGDARNLDKIENESIDLVATHPPNADIVLYTDSSISDDLSKLEFEDFMAAIGNAASECYRILKPNHYCAILVGDTRKFSHYVPLSIGILGRFLNTGFILKEDIIKLQHNMRSSSKDWSAMRSEFYLISHEHVFVMRKPDVGEQVDRFRLSRDWWRYPE